MYFISYVLNTLRRFTCYSFIAIASFCINSSVHAEQILLDLTNLAAWDKHSFKGTTDYRVVDLEGRKVVRAESFASASGLIVKKTIDLRQTPWLSWQWRVDKPLQGVDERSKSGDDYSARVYVIVSGGVFFWKTRALNYVWSSQQAANSQWPNAFTDQAQMLAVRGKDAPLHTWLTEKRNVYNDLREIYGEDIDSIDGIAIMTDADNSSAHTIAFYGNLRFSSE